jgi:hypothetical protein
VLTWYTASRLAGKGTTFYSFLDVPSTASTKQIDKAFKKASMQYQSVCPSSDQTATRPDELTPVQPPLPDSAPIRRGRPRTETCLTPSTPA